MIEVLYRILEVIPPTGKFNAFGNEVATKEIERETIVCNDRKQFKSIIKDTYGEKISFRRTKDTPVGTWFCSIIVENTYYEERDSFLTSISYECPICKTKVTTYSKNINSTNTITKQDIKYLFNGDNSHLNKKFCSHTCKEQYFENYAKTDDNFIPNTHINKKEFKLNDGNIEGFIYKISKKSDQSYYIGKTTNLPIFRWMQHMKTQRFPFENIEDYIFEVLQVILRGEDIDKAEQSYIKEASLDKTKICLNKIHNEQIYPKQ